ncbi:hypothetical protein [Pseudophaeobacter sp.]|uniref:hypothetical protein n=1 Tax=Pseudophaeobacter sp. TaxID=1971739 RepID=UPI003A9810FF
MNAKVTKSFSSFSTTRVGALNRDIEKGMKLVVSGSRGATGEVIAKAKKRQALLAARPFKVKQTA